MKRLFTLLMFVFVLSQGSLLAQDKTRFEAFAGYSLLRLHLPETFEGENTRILQSIVGTMPGWNAGLTANITNNFGITGDVSGYYRKLEGELDGTKIKVTAGIHSFLVGPRVSGSKGKVRPFAHALFGVGKIYGTANFDSQRESFDNKGFAMSFGGGLDVVVADKIAIRPIQFDFFPTRQKSPEFGTSSITLKNIRFGTAVVFYFTD